MVDPSYLRFFSPKVAGESNVYALQKVQPAAIGRNARYIGLKQLNPSDASHKLDRAGHLPDHKAAFCSCQCHIHTLTVYINHDT